MVKKTRLRMALFGAGGFGANHLASIEEMQAEGLVELVAIADPFVDQLAEVKTRVEGRGVRWFKDFHELLATLSGGLDAVAVATPIPWHLPMLNAALDRGLAVYLEKPPVPLLQDFLKVAERPESARVAVGFHLIADAVLQNLKRAILDGAFGRIIRISATACWPRLSSYYERASWAGRMSWRDLPVFDGPATNALAHVVHNVMFLAGPTIEEFATPEEVCGEVYRVRPIESYDVSCMNGRFTGGTRFSVALAHAAERRDNWAIAIHGERGRARLSDSGKILEATVTLPPPLAAAPIEIVRKSCWSNFHSFATGGGQKPLTSLGDCRGYVVATNAMLLSSGGIHRVPPEVCHPFDLNGSSGLAVEGINDLLEKTHEAGRLFSDLAVPWAVPGRTIETGALRSIPFAKLSSLG